MSSQRPKYRCLVVEDEWLLRMHLVDELSDAGWQTLEAGTGEEALAIIDSEPAIDFLITDIRLPGPVDGWGVAERFHGAHSGAPVIYVSANPDLLTRRAPGSLFFGKPVDVKLLLEACDRLVLALD
jgi:two-component system OmpR family response regulator